MNILIVAGNHMEFTAYKRQKLNQALMNEDAGLGMEVQAYRYVDSADKLRGMRDVSGVFIGSWRSREDILEIVAQLRFMMTQRNPALERVWNELCKEATALQVTQAVSAPSVRRAADELAKEIDEHILQKIMLEDTRKLSNLPPITTITNGGRSASHNTNSNTAIQSNHTSWNSLFD